MARRVRGDGELRGLLIAECDRFEDRFRDRGLRLDELRDALVDGRAVCVAARTVFSALYNAGHPGWRDFTYMKVHDAEFVLAEDDVLVPAAEFVSPAVHERDSRAKHRERYRARIRGMS